METTDALDARIKTTTNNHTSVEPDQTATSVQANNGVAVPCRHLNHPDFDLGKNIFRILHYIILTWIPSRISTTGYKLISTIEELTSCIGEENRRNPPKLQISEYTDINGELFIKFQRHLLSRNKSLSHAEIFKSAIAWVANETGKIPLILLPIVRYERRNPSEPLDEDGFNELELALRTHIVSLYEKLKFRALVDAAEPFEFETLRNELAPPVTRRSLLEWYNYIEYNTVVPARAVLLSQRAQEIGDQEIVEICKKKVWRPDIEALYEKEIGPIGKPCSKSPVAKPRLYEWQPPIERLIKTLLVNGYPLEITISSLDSCYSRTAIQKQDTFRDILTIILNRLSKHSPRGRGREDSLPVMEHVLELYFPTQEDMSAITLYLMLQSGWNKETVLAIDPDNFEHPLTSAFDDNMKVVFSEKNKSQGSALPYADPVRINAPTRSDDPFSMYSLIKLASALSAPLVDFTEHEDEGGSRVKKLNLGFLALRTQKEWKKGGRVTSAAHILSYSGGVKTFFENNVVHSNGARLRMAGDITLRLRPTWLMHKKVDSPMSMLSNNMGHANRNTTDIYYDNSGAANMARNARLRSELEEVLELLRARRFKGLLGAQAQAEATADLKIFHIPGHGQRALWACSDQSRPDWPGANLIFRSGRTKCCSISRCVFCSNMRVFEDSLVYIIERLVHIDEVLDDSDVEDTEFSSRLVSEKKALEWILDNWGDDKAVIQAERDRVLLMPLLPRNLETLEIIFESETVNV